MRRDRRIRSFEIVFVLVILTLVIGQVLGQPLLLSYVETGSMEPTLSPGDGFVVVPPGLAGGVAAGDIVIYRAVQLHGGGLTTHRVVDATNRGYVTRGDANAFSDQAGGEPLVQRPQILAEAVTIQGRPVVVPGVGDLVSMVRDALRSGSDAVSRAIGLRVRGSATAVGLLISLVGLSLYLRGRLAGRSIPASPDPPARPNRRKRSDRPLLIGALVLVTIATAGMTVPGGSQAYGIVSAENDGPGPRVIEAGSTETTTYLVRNEGLMPTYVMLEPRSAGIEVHPSAFRLGPGQERAVELTITAPDDIGYHRTYLDDRRYLLIWPAALIRSLHGVHPWVAILGIDAFLASLLMLAGRLILGAPPAAPRDGPASPPSPGWSDR